MCPSHGCLMVPGSEFGVRDMADGGPVSGITGFTCRLRLLRRFHFFSSLSCVFRCESDQRAARLSLRSPPSGSLARGPSSSNGDFSGWFASRFFGILSPRMNPDGHGRREKQRFGKQKAEIGEKRKERGTTRSQRTEDAGRRNRSGTRSADFSPLRPLARPNG